MTRAAVAGLVSALLAVGGLPTGIPENLLFNPVERTRSGLAALESGDLDTAAERLATAGRLAPQNPLALYNDGTAKLLVGDAEASEVLQAAAGMAPEDLRAAAHYNLGNSWLAQGGLEAAIAAYEDALRAEPGLAAAKHNLELALRLRDEQQRRQGEEEGEQDQDQDRDQGEQRNDDQPAQAPDEPREEQETEDERGEEDREDARDRQDGSPSGESEEPGGDPEALPGFEPQADMTPEQAAAILEAVENLEREQRRQAAAERARQQPGGGKDW